MTRAPFILGTAGHVDHGKTTLIRFLTGVNTDRLLEEQKRGITIELGFAPFEVVRDGETVRAGIVDAPGHERFVKHMAAGAGAVDVLMMVIAADEGIMPQTREHLAICELLGIRVGLIVLSKVDLVDEEWLALVEEDVRAAVGGTFLADAPIVPFTPKASDPEAQRRRIEDAILTARERVTAHNRDALFRLPIDRVFTLKGHGTLVTGSVIGGDLALGDDVVAEPGARRATTRSLETFGESVENVSGGMRAAINLRGVEPDELTRGMVLVRPNTVRATDVLDLRFRYLPHNPKPLRRRGAAIAHVGAAHSNAVVRLLDAETLAPGEEALVRVQLDEPVLALPGDRVVLRGFADVPGHGRTLGGGLVLQLAGEPYVIRKRGARLTAYLQRLMSGTPDERLLTVLEAVGPTGLNTMEAAVRTGLGPAETRRRLESLAAENLTDRVEEEPAIYVARSVMDSLATRLLTLLEENQKERPLDEGVGREQLRLRLGATQRTLANVIGKLVASQRIAVDSRRDRVMLEGTRHALGGADADLADTLMAAVEGAGLAVPRLEQLAQETGAEPRRVKAVAALLVRHGKLVRITEELYVARAILDELRTRLVARLGEGPLSTQDMKTMTGLSRRWLIPLAEYFDKEKVTLRRGEERILHPQWHPSSE